jgi:hypothetical protein
MNTNLDQVEEFTWIRQIEQIIVCRHSRHLANKSLSRVGQ